METENIEAAMEKAEELFRRETPFKWQEKYSYSITAESAFEKIRKASSDGFSFVQICAALAKVGLLPNNANPHSFRQAFHREAMRRERGKKLPEMFSKRTEPEHIADSPVRL